jgi:hypothetical protein
MAIQPGHADTERLARANREIREQALTALGRRRADAHTRQQLDAMDHLIGALEERNLRGDRRVDRAVRRWVRGLQNEVPVPLPRRVLRARSTARLHGALLDWMELVFRELAPARQGQAQRHDASTRHDD